MFISKELRAHYKRQGNKLVPKTGYNTSEEAKKREKRSSRSVYLCGICNKYHVGRTSKRVG